MTVYSQCRFCRSDLPRVKNARNAFCDTHCRYCFAKTSRPRPALKSQNTCWLCGIKTRSKDYCRTCKERLARQESEPDGYERGYQDIVKGTVNSTWVQGTLFEDA